VLYSIKQKYSLHCLSPQKSSINSILYFVLCEIPHKTQDHKAKYYTSHSEAELGIYSYPYYAMIGKVEDYWSEVEFLRMYSKSPKTVGGVQSL
jgi:hypothetical protein